MPAKAISSHRDLLQSRALLWIALPTFLLLLYLADRHAATLRPSYAGEVLAISLIFAFVAWRLRAASPLAAVVGGIICLVITLFTSKPGSTSPARTGLCPLLLLFVLTFAATRLGREQKARAGLAESKRGRNAAQVLANLGVAALSSALCVAPLRAMPTAAASFHLIPNCTPMLAALVEATADTVSSEIGQAFGGTPRMLLTLRRVPPGTDGAVTLTGTLAGVAAGALLAATGISALRLTPHDAAIALLAGSAGLFFDSLLGATVERTGWIGNDLVNLTSTLFAAALAALLVAHT